MSFDQKKTRQNDDFAKEKDKLAIESLRLFGANVEEGLGRCMQNEGIYLRMVALACDDANFDRLRDELKAMDK